MESQTNARHLASWPAGESAVPRHEGHTCPTERDGGAGRAGWAPRPARHWERLTDGFLQACDPAWLAVRHLEACSVPIPLFCRAVSAVLGPTPSSPLTGRVSAGKARRGTTRSSPGAACPARPAWPASPRRAPGGRLRLPLSCLCAQTWVLGAQPGKASPGPFFPSSALAWGGLRNVPPWKNGVFVRPSVCLSGKVH